MSWSYSFEGNPATVKQSVNDDATRQSLQYKDKPEERDILAIKNCIIANIEDMVFDENLPNVKVYAYGSHSTSDKGLVATSASFQVSAIK